MKKTLTIILVVLLVLLLLAGAVYLTYSETAAYYESLLPESVTAEKILEIQSYLDYYFIDAEDMDEDAMADAAAEAMIEATGDEWSYYLSADQYGDYMEAMTNSYVGIGVTITEDAEAGGMVIQDVTPGSPAYEAGILTGDVLTHVEGESTLELGMEGTQGLVRGKEGTSVHLKFLRGGEAYEVDVERRTIETVVADCVLLEGDIGLVTIYNFDERCASETIACIEQMLEEGAEGLIFDVRFNGGGYKDEMVEVLDYLLPEGELFVSIDYAGREEVDTSDAAHLDIPMAVLVNQDSYSAAEFFAAAIQEYGAGQVVGTRTTGKGKFQTAFDLSDGSILNISIGKYYTPGGVSLSDAGGIVPDVELDLEEQDYYDLYYGVLAYEDDEQLVAAIDVLRQKMS